MTDVTIRGIEDDVYSAFSAEARKRGVPIGELVTQVMRIFLEESLDRSYVVDSVDELDLTKAELESVGRPVVFQGLRTLTIADDVDWETFDKYVDQIRNSRTVIIPNTLTKLQVLTKCRKVKDLLMAKQ